MTARFCSWAPDSKLTIPHHSKFDEGPRVAGRGRSKHVPRLTQRDSPEGAGRLISLCHPWRRSNRRPLAGGLLPHAMTVLKFGARFLSITRFHRSGGAGLRSRQRSRPLRAVPLRTTGGIRASSPAGETGMSEQAGADLPVARDGEGQLSMDALRSPAAGTACDRLASDENEYGQNFNDACR